MKGGLALGRDPAERGQFADHPIRLQRIRIPRLSPAVLDAGMDGARIDMLAKFVEEGQLTAGLF